MAVSYKGLLEELTRKHNIKAKHDAQLVELPALIVEAVRSKLDVPGDSCYYGGINANGRFEKGAAKIADGRISFAINVVFQVDHVTHECPIKFSAFVDGNYYDVSMGGENLMLQYAPDVDQEQLSDIVNAFAGQLRAQVDGLLQRK